MNTQAWHRFSLRRTLLLVLVPGMLLLVAAELWLTWRTSVDAANAAYDRSLLGAIKSIVAPIATENIPADVRPLVEAMNHHVTRHRMLIEARRRFIDDASHQLRTPLTTLATKSGSPCASPMPRACAKRCWP